MRKSSAWIATWSLGMVLAIVPTSVFAAAGSSAPTPTPAPTPPIVQQTPEEQAAQLYNEGLRFRDKAWKLEEKARGAGEGPEKAKLLGKVQKQFEKASERFANAVKLDPNMYQAHSSLGYALRRLGKYDDALVAYDRALELNAYYPEAIEYRAEAYLGLNRIEDAKQAYMSLFAADRARADELFAAMKRWLAAREEDPAGVAPQTLEDFQDWFQGRAELASQTSQLSHGLRSW